MAFWDSGLDVCMEAFYGVFKGLLGVVWEGAYHLKKLLTGKQLRSNEPSPPLALHSTFMGG